MKLYLAGPMAGMPDGNFPAFRGAAVALRAAGHEIISPVELNEADGMDAAANPGHPLRAAFIKRDLEIVLRDDVDGLVLLPGWELSEGATLEVGIAEALGKRVLLFPSLADVKPDRHPASARFHEILRGLADLHDRKQADYGRGEDPFANVRGSTEWGIDGWVGAMIRATDKVRRLQTFSRTGSLANEGVLDAFDDLAVYAVIARVLFEQQQATP